jgi:hypothetical protein
MKRRRGGAKRLDLAPLKEILKDRRCWTCMGTVVVPEGESSHFEIITTDGQQDVLVDVETQPEGLDLTARLNDAAIWRIPNVGDEVAIVIPAGELDFMPIIVATCASGTLPDGVAENVTVIANGQVLIHDGAGGAEELVKKSEFDAHKHSGLLGGTASALAQTTVPSDALHAPAPITGTSILKAK